MDVTGETLLMLLVALGGLASAGVIGLALAALVRRRSWPYLLVTLALGTLLARTGAAVASLWLLLPEGIHHLLEHALDVLMAALVIAAVVTARRAREEVDHERDA